MSDIEMKPINFLWPDRIALGKLTVVARPPGSGKSQLMAKLAATVTMGLSLADTQKRSLPGKVVILSAEDDAADTIKPRLIAAGADESLCHILRWQLRPKPKMEKIPSAISILLKILSG